MRSPIFFLTIMIAVFAFCASPLVAEASEQNVKIDELGISLLIPEIYELQSPEKENNIYLNSVSKIRNEDFIITMTPNKIESIKSYENTKLIAFTSVIVETYKGLGIDVPKYNVYQTRQTKFARIYFYNAEEDVYGLQYYTIEDNKAMNFTLRSYGYEISDSQEKTVREIIDSIKFDTITENNNNTIDNPAFDYSDSSSRIVFTVPDNWKRDNAFVPEKNLDVKFFSTREDDLTIIFGAIDLWDSLDEIDKLTIRRSDINNSVFTAKQLAELCNFNTEKCFVKKINDKQFKFFEFEIESNYTGLTLYLYTTQCVYIQDGFLYWFQFSGGSDNYYFSDFEKLLASVKIGDEVFEHTPSPTEPEQTNNSGHVSYYDTTPTPSSAPKQSDNSKVKEYVVFWLITSIIVITTLLLIFKDKQ